jgi:hypothetical protein
MKYRIYSKTTQNIEPEYYGHFFDAFNALQKAMKLNPDEDFSILNEREL